MTKLGDLARRLAKIERKLPGDQRSGPITLEDVREARAALAALLCEAQERERRGLPPLPASSKPLSPDRAKLLELLQPRA